MPGRIEGAPTSNQWVAIVKLGAQQRNSPDRLRAFDSAFAGVRMNYQTFDSPQCAGDSIGMAAALSRVQSQQIYGRPARRDRIISLGLHLSNSQEW